MDSFDKKKRMVSDQDFIKVSMYYILIFVALFLYSSLLTMKDNNLNRIISIIANHEVYIDLSLAALGVCAIQLMTTANLIINHLIQRVRRKEVTKEAAKE